MSTPKPTLLIHSRQSKVLPDSISYVTTSPAIRAGNKTVCELDIAWDVQVSADVAQVTCAECLAFTNEIRHSRVQAFAELPSEATENQTCQLKEKKIKGDLI